MKFQRLKECRCVSDRQRANLRQHLSANAHIARFLPQARPFAIRTARVAAILRKKHADVQLVFLRFQPVEKSAYAVPIAFAVDDGVPLLTGQFIKRNVYGNAVRATEAPQILHDPFILRLGPRFDCAFGKRQTRIRNDEIEIKTNRVAESLTRWARAEGIVEAEKPRLRSRVNCSVVFTFETFRKVKAGWTLSARGGGGRELRTFSQLDGGLAMSFAKARLKRVNQPLANIFTRSQTIDQHVNVFEIVSSIIIGR